MEYPKKSAALFASLLIHAILVYVALTSKFPLKIIPKKTQVRDVYLVPPGQIIVPGDIDRAIRSISDLGDDFDEFLRGAAASRSQRRQAARGQITEVEGLEVGPGRLAELDARGRGHFLDYSEGFRLNLPLRPDASPPSGGELNLTWNSRSQGNLPPGSGSAKNAGKLRRSLYSDMLGSGSGSGSGSGFLPRGRASGSRQRGSAYFDAGNYDITPWAREVITRIQNNWTIPQAKGGADRGEVGIVAAIGKDGSLKEIKILNATNVSLLDEAALRAVEQSAPFPALPPDFPRTILEAYFVFKYGE